LDLQRALEQLEFRLIDEALRLAHGKKSAAAQLLRLKRTTLVAKLRKRRRTPLAAAIPGKKPREARQPDARCETDLPAERIVIAEPAERLKRVATLRYGEA
jgi:hypothetical protein